LSNPHDPLYFIALIPPPAVQESIRTLQGEMSHRFHSQAALKSPPHITLIPPLPLSEPAVALLREELQRTSQPLAPFPIVLEGFAAFAPRVVYVHVQPSVALSTLQSHLIDRLQQQPPLQRPLNSRHRYPFIPHITIGFRDLSVEHFEQAWPEFQHRSFQTTFLAEALTLFQHNGQQDQQQDRQHWEPIATYPFRNRDSQTG